jgi:phenylpropionate dioxygenase-like ring-hydroxylating dioxygenase large terminal subunit
MLSREENELLTRTGPGTPMGNLMRRYWVPALYSHQLPEVDGPPVRVKLLSEELVAFRDSTGQVGLLEEHCAHRGASLYWGRNEECGLRCVYHGWKYDRTGQCVDQPAEPEESTFKDRIMLTAYPCRERGGVVWTYMGPPALQPALPEYEWAVVPDSHRFVTRHVQECNWLQGVEGGFDPTHVPFLHREAAYFGLDDPSGAAVLKRLLYKQTEIYPLAGGYAFASNRDNGAGGLEWSVEHWLLPFHKLIRGFGPDALIGTHMWMPIDDETCMTYTVEYHPDRSLTDEDVERCIRGWTWLHVENLPNSDRAALNSDNDYGVDRALQKSGKSFTGIKGFGLQDAMIQESMGPIVDRSREHLGSSDTTIITIRRLLLQLLKDLEAGASLPGLDPASHRMRSTMFHAPKELPFLEAAGDAIRARSAAYAALDGHASTDDGAGAPRKDLVTH